MIITIWHSPPVLYLFHPLHVFTVPSYPSVCYQTYGWKFIPKGCTVHPWMIWVCRCEMQGPTIYTDFFFLVYTCHTICSWLHLWMWNCKYKRLNIKLYTISDCVGVWVCVGAGVISTPNLHIVQVSTVLCTAKKQNKTKTQPSISSLLSNFNFLKCAYSLSWTQSETSTVMVCG